MSSNSNKVVEKASGIIAAIENCGCTHCLSILKSGLGQRTPEPDAENTKPVTKRFGYV